MSTVEKNAKKCQVECKRCGRYDIDTDFSHELNNRLDRRGFFKLSSWIREQNTQGATPHLQEDNVSRILELRDKRIVEKLEYMMRYLAEHQEEVTLNDDIIVASWMKNERELNIIFKKALDQKYIEGTENSESENKFPFFKRLTFDGLEYIESVDAPNKSSDNVFVAFNFTDELKEIFNIYVRSAVEDAGLRFVFVNQNTTPHDQKITDEIIVNLKSARMIIADFTNNSTNVYFEAGFAMGMKIPVIWTCKEGHQFSFDTAQYPHIVWKNGEDLQKQLYERILAIL